MREIVVRAISCPPAIGSFGFDAGPDPAEPEEHETFLALGDGCRSAPESSTARNFTAALSIGPRVGACGNASELAWIKRNCVCSKL